MAAAVTVLEILAEFQPGHALEHGGQAGIFIFDRIAQPIAGRVKIGKQAFDVLLRGVTAGRGFNLGKDVRQVGIQALVGIGMFSHIAKQLAGVDKVSLGFDGIGFNLRRDNAVRQFGIINALVARFDVAGEVLTDKAIKQRAEHVLLEVPAIDGAADIVGDLPDLTLYFGALLGAGHAAIALLFRICSLIQVTFPVFSLFSP